MECISRRRCKKMDYPQLKTGLFTVGVEALLLAREDVDGDDMLRDNQDDLELHLQRVLAGDYEASIDPNVESPVPTSVSGRVIEPSSLTLLNTRVPAALLDHVDLNAKQYLWTWPIRREAVIRILILLALLVVCSGAVLWRVPHYVRPILVALAFAFVWMICGAWLQAVEGGLNQNFTTLPKACWATAESLGVKLPLPISPVPTSTTRQGTRS
jgi:hypothetical protein